LSVAEPVCVELRSVSKKFARSLKRSFVYGARDIGRLLLGRLLPRVDPDALRPSEFWAVRDVSFGLRRGRSLGIVGQNGSGKTTLLRMVAGVLRPTLGSVRVDGAIAPMLALGAGFKPVLSGRENVFLNLALLGVGERAARARFDAILDFAELHDAIDAPLGTYSSGMQARLGFACAVHTEPSILIVDEVLAVGDARFRMKCRNRINELRRAGTSLLLVSHSPILVEALCDEVLFLRAGRAEQLGPPREVLKAYEDDLLQHVNEANAARSQARVERPLAEGAPLAVRGVDLHTPGGGSGHWTCGRDAELVLDLHSRGPLGEVSVNLMIADLVHQPGETVQMMTSSRDVGWLRLAGGDARVTVALPRLGLRPGTYRLKVSVSRGAMHDMLDSVDDVRLVVRADGNAADHCLYFQSRDWQFAGAEVQEGVEGAVDAVGIEGADDA
jgi:lipopolysaccharide transport system ATP-binding protein